MAITGKHSLGQLLIQAGKIDEDQLQKALTIQKEKDVYIGVIFKELGYLDERELNRYISQQLKIPYLSLGHYDVDKTIMGLIPERIIRSKNFLPLFRLNNTLNIAGKDMQFKIPSYFHLIGTRYDHNLDINGNETYFNVGGNANNTTMKINFYF